MKRIAVAIVTGIIVAMWPRPASACTCGPSTDEVSFDRAEFVFAGTPIQLESAYIFEVDRVWKGDVSKTFELSRLDGAACGYERFELGVRYLIFAGGGRLSGTHPAAGLCTTTRPFRRAFQSTAAADETLAILGKGYWPSAEVTPTDVVLAPPTASIPSPAAIDKLRTTHGKSDTLASRLQRALSRSSRLYAGGGVMALLLGILIFALRKMR